MWIPTDLSNTPEIPQIIAVSKSTIPIIYNLDAKMEEWDRIPFISFITLGKLINESWEWMMNLNEIS